MIIHVTFILLWNYCIILCEIWNIDVYACAKTYLSWVEMMIEWLKNWFVSKEVKGATPCNWITWLHNQIENFKLVWLSFNWTFVTSLCQNMVYMITFVVI